MKKSSSNGLTVLNWTIPAFQSSTGFKTCPNAGSCAAGCYARSGTYRFSNVVAAHEAKLVLSQGETFVLDMLNEIDSWLLKRNTKTIKIRIHDAGDFYSLEYLEKWCKIMSHYDNNPKVSFYAYTKQVKMIKSYGKLPSNFTVIFSLGGKQDSMINQDTDRHSKVFESVKELKAAGYIDSTQDDMIAATHKNPKIVLVYHGAKNYDNTLWDKAS